MSFFFFFLFFLQLNFLKIQINYFNFSFNQGDCHVNISNFITNLQLIGTFKYIFMQIIFWYKLNFSLPKYLKINSQVMTNSQNTPPKYIYIYIYIYVGTSYLRNTVEAEWTGPMAQWPNPRMLTDPRTVN